MKSAKIYNNESWTKQAKLDKIDSDSYMWVWYVRLVGSYTHNQERNEEYNGIRLREYHMNFTVPHLMGHIDEISPVLLNSPWTQIIVKTI